MTLHQQIVEHVSLGYKITFEPQPFNIAIHVSRGEIKKESWLPTSDHCDEGNITGAINYMVDEIRKANKGL